MLIETTRFGSLEIADHREITLTRRLVGFEAYSRFVLLEGGKDSCFWWLQSTEEADLAFVVTDPGQFDPDYAPPIGDELLEALGCRSLDRVQVLVIVNKRERTLTANLQGPIVINVQERIGQQLVLSDKQFTPRAPLMQLDPSMAASA